MNEINLTVEEISKLEHRKYYLKSHLHRFLDIDWDNSFSEGEKIGGKLSNFDTYLLIKGTLKLLDEIDETVINKYYDGKEIEIKRDAQRRYCGDTHNFADFGTNAKGECLDCGNNIWEEITLAKASNELITGCPICNRSYCD